MPRTPAQKAFRAVDFFRAVTGDHNAHLEANVSLDVQAELFDCADAIYSYLLETPHGRDLLVQRGWTFEFTFTRTPTGPGNQPRK